MPTTQVPLGLIEVPAFKADLITPTGLIHLVVGAVDGTAGIGDLVDLLAHQYRLPRMMQMTRQTTMMATTKTVIPSARFRHQGR
jgi:hypothetical protein